MSRLGILYRPPPAYEGNDSLLLGLQEAITTITIQLVDTEIFSIITFLNTTFNKSCIHTNDWMVYLSLFRSLSYLGLPWWRPSFYKLWVVLQGVVINGVLFLGLTMFAMQMKDNFASWDP
ncbi:hypothetical protein RUND412_007012, partial [Rhizina undulata]